MKESCPARASSEYERREKGAPLQKRTEHDLNSVEWGPSQISIFLLSRRSRPNKGEREDHPGEGRRGEREKGIGNNFTRSNWLRFIIYDLGNNPRWMEKRGKGEGRRWGDSGPEDEKGEGSGDTEDRARSREAGRKYMRMKKKKKKRKREREGEGERERAG